MDALLDFDRVVEGDPRRAAAIAHRGCARAALGDLRGALEDLDRAVAQDPDDLLARYHRARLLLRLGDPAAREDLKRIGLSGE